MILWHLFQVNFTRVTEATNHTSLKITYLQFQTTLPGAYKLNWIVHRWKVDSHQGAVTRKECPCHGVLKPVCTFCFEAYFIMQSNSTENECGKLLHFIAKVADKSVLLIIYRTHYQCNIVRKYYLYKNTIYSSSHVMYIISMCWYDIAC